MNIAFICSAGGGPIEQAVALCPEDKFFLITDRPCPAEAIAERHNITHRRLTYLSATQFSQEAAHTLRETGSYDAVVMLYSRLVTEPLLGEFPLFNIHPSLLPAYKGMGAVKKTYAGGSRFLGATLHGVVAEADAGQIVAQASAPIQPHHNADNLGPLSFLQKTALLLLAIDLTRNGRIAWENGQPQLTAQIKGTHALNPFFLNTRYADHIRHLQAERNEYFL